MDLMCLGLRRAKLTAMLADRHRLPNGNRLPDGLRAPGGVCASERWGGRALLDSRAKTGTFS